MVNNHPAIRTKTQSALKNLLLVALLHLVGCTTLAPEPAQPVVPAGTFSLSGEAILPLRWWESLSDPALQQLETAALANNPDLLATQARLIEAEALARQTGANLFPQLGAGLFSSDSDGTTLNEASLAASYEVDFWGGLEADAESARQSWLASREALDAAAITLTAEVADSWYQLIEQQGQERLLSEQQQTNRQLLELLELRFDRGIVKATDVLQQRQLVESAEGSLATTRANAAVLEHQLAALLGQPATATMELPVGTLVQLPPLPATGLPSQLLQRRPDVRQALFLLRAAEADVAVAVADRFPSLSLTATLSSTAGGWSTLFEDWIGTIGAELFGPVFDGGQRAAEVDRTRAAATAALHDYGTVVVEAVAEVEDALIRELQQALLLQSLERQLELTSGVVERISYNYTKGVADYLEVLDALRTYQTLQRDELTARRTLVSYRLVLYRSLAGGWEPEPLAQKMPNN